MQNKWAPPSGFPRSLICLCPLGKPARWCRFVPLDTHWQKSSVPCMLSYLNGSLTKKNRKDAQGAYCPSIDTVDSGEKELEWGS